MGKIRNALIYMGVALFMTYAYANDLTQSDRVWLQTLFSETLRSLVSAVTEMLMLVVPLLSQVWHAAAHYVVYALLLVTVVAVGFGVVVYVVNLRDQTRKQIDAGIDSLEGLL
ncbi:MAG: hypothetical protein KDE47_04990 [Caldilineaceae bacterium]|nr:hypothetical protein [Caldilineaceae bacterium]